MENLDQCVRCMKLGLYDNPTAVIHFPQFNYVICEKCAKSDIVAFEDKIAEQMERSYDDKHGYQS